MNYHIDIGFPKTLVIPERLVNLSYTKHALDRRQRDEKKEQLKVLPSIVRLKAENIFEVHTNDDINCTKVLMRTSYDYSRDMILVLELYAEDTEKAKVITFWLNLKKDKHKNFKTDRYDIPKDKLQTDE